MLDAAGGLAVTALGLLATRATTRPDVIGPGPGGAVPRLARRWAWAVTGAAARSRKRCYQVPVEAVGLGDGGPCAMR